MTSNKIFNRVKIKHVDIIYFLEIICLANFSFIFYCFYFWFLNFFFEYQFDFSSKNIKFIIYIISCIMIFFSVYFYKKSPARKIEIKDMDNIPKYKYIKIIDFYRVLLLLFSISTFIIFVWFSVIFNIIFLYIGIIMYMLIPIFVFSLFIKLPLHYTLSSANNIFNDYIYEGKKDNYTINKFNKYFKKSIDAIDGDLPHGLKIDNLTNEDNTSIKNTIKYYLSPYIEYGDQSQIDSLKNNIDEMVECIDNNDKKIPLDITTFISNIYNDINKFLRLHNYSVVKLNRYIYLVDWLKLFGLLILAFLFFISLFNSIALTNLLFIIIMTIGYIFIPIISKRYKK